MRKFMILFVIVAFTGSLFAVTGEVLWSEDFEDAALGAYVDADGFWNADGNAAYEIVEDASDLFGNGATNKIMKIFTTGSQQYKSWVNVVPIDGGPAVATWTLKVHQITGGAIWATTGQNAPAGGNKFSTSNWESGTLNGTADAYPVETTISVDLVCNTTASDVTYADGSTILAAETMDIWVDSVLVKTLNKEAFTGTAIVGIKINARTEAQGQTAETYIDGVQLIEGAAYTSNKIAKNPSPSNGKPLVAVDDDLSWDAPSGVTPDSYTFTMRANDPNFAAGGNIIDGVSVTPVDPTTTYALDTLDFETTYYWKVDVVAGVDTHVGNVWSFTTKALDAPPVVEAGDNILTTLELAGSLAMGGSVTDDGTSALTIDGWEAFEASAGGSTTKVTFADASDPATTVTISEPGTYILKLTATDALGSVSDQKEITVYADACDAAKATGEWTVNHYDRNEDCIVDMTDFAVFATEWLNSTALTEDWVYEGDFGDPANSLIAEYWTGINGGEPNDLLANENYPDAPDGAYFVTDELRGTLSGDAYGQRIYGYIEAPATGDYTFYIASDDGSRLFLSSDINPVDTDPALGNHIAEVLGWAGVDVWDKEAGQASSPVSLTAGQYYYIEVLHKEGTGGDNVSVGWSTDGGTTIDVIPGTALRTELQ